MVSLMGATKNGPTNGYRQHSLKIQYVQEHGCGFSLVISNRKYFGQKYFWKEQLVKIQHW